MGAWGYGPFDNDGGMDFVTELSQCPPDGVGETLREVMAEVLEEAEYLDRDQASAAIAAACLVADRLSPGLITDANGREYADRLAFDVPDGLRELAARVFVRAYQPVENEWHELWEEADALALVRVEHDPYQAALAR